jgi:C1A family cysteine protease
MLVKKKLLDLSKHILFLRLKPLKEPKMRTPVNRYFIGISFMILVFYGCTKNSDFNGSGDLQQPTNLTADSKHGYGLLPMTPDQYANIPLYSSESFRTAKALAAVAKVVRLWNPDIRDQGQIGSCTAFCGAESDEILYHYKNGTVPVLSPAFIYYCERVLILKQKITADQGAYMVNIPQALQKYGDCLETSYTYPSSNTSTAYKTPPTAGAMTEGLSYVIGQKSTSYAMVVAGDTAAVKNILRNNIPVMMGFNVYDNRSYTLFERLNTTSYTYNPLTKNGTLVSGAKLLGGHAVPIIGYDDTKGVFLCQNSWGTSWGNSGFFLLPYSVFRSTRIVPNGSVYYATLN